MPNLPRDTMMGPTHLRAYLSEVLPSSELTEVLEDTHYQPLILLRTNQLIAGFGFSNSDMIESYKHFYTGFKKQYTDSRNEWDLLDLAFVFCVPPDAPGLESFSSRVETDVYFCRKFIVPLSLPIATAVAHLPFLPLAPAQGQSLRPLSAQTFLQQYGLTAVLAKYLVVQGVRSPLTIVEDSLSGKFGYPKSITRSSTDFVPITTNDISPTRLERIEVQNFRAYRRKTTISLGYNVTILYGPNGFGKTSLFDAVDFVTTGDIGRLGVSSDDRFRKIAAHLDSKEQDGSVSLVFAENGAERKIIRYVKDRKRALLDGTIASRKSILSHLTGGNSPEADRIEHLVSLFRATHFFGQDHLELAKDFERDCELSPQVVSRLLAFEDYSNAANKAFQVCKVLEKSIGVFALKIKDLEKHVEDAEEELAQFGRVSSDPINSRELDEAIRLLCHRISDAGFIVTSDTPGLETLREWRTTFDARSAEAQAKRSRWLELVEDAIELPKLRVELAGVRTEVTKKQAALSTKISAQKESEVVFRDAEHKVAEEEQRRSALQERLNSLAWLSDNVSSYTTLLERQQIVLKVSDEAREANVLAEEGERKAVENLNEREGQKADVLGKLRVVHKRVADLNGVIEACDGWDKQRRRLIDVTDKEEAKTKSLEKLQVEVQVALAMLERMKTKEADLLSQINQVDGKQSEMRGLLSQVQRHLRNGVCPLCGQDHGSLETLLERIEEWESTDAASELRIAFSKLCNDIREAKASQASLVERQKETAEQLEILQSERVALAEAIEVLGKRAEEVGVEVHYCQPPPIRELEDQRNRLLDRAAMLEQEATIRNKDIEVADRLVEEARQGVKASRDAVSTQKQLIGDIQRRIEEFRKDPRIGQEPIDLSVTEINQRMQGAQEDLARVRDSWTISDKHRARRRETWAAACLAVSSAQTELSRLQVNSADLLAKCNERAARLREAGLPEDINESGLVELITRMAQEQARNAELRDAVTAIELRVDVASTSAAAVRLHQRVRDRKDSIATARRAREQRERWLKYFEGLSDLLSSEQSVAVAGFTREYGPRTSVIQKRLRSVLGFDEIEILSEESRIMVRAKRKGEVLRPTDYFSQSQQQTLLLGLFLTASLSQTWSALSSVFLDDPITHFDDLNTYAFLDLIVGLLDSGSCHRQFVISTCDEKFLRLACQKFRHLGDRARYYTFAAIGEEGPEIHEGLLPFNGTTR